jgi:hypothetical protein
MSNPRGKKIDNTWCKNQPDSDTELAVWFSHDKQGARGANEDEKWFLNRGGAY